jgi:hypothetical protein
MTWFPNLNFQDLRRTRVSDISKGLELNIKKLKDEFLAIDPNKIFD